MKKWVVIFSILVAAFLPLYGQAANVEFGAYVTALGSGSSGIAAADLVPIVQGGVAKKVTIGQLIGLYIADGTDGTWGLGLKNNASAIATPTGYDGVLGFVGGTPVFRIGTGATIPLVQKVLPIATNCTIGSDCDGTSVAIAYGGLLLCTTACEITLPEIVASPSATQVAVGASICVMSRDQNEVAKVIPNAADSITPKDHAKQTAGNYMLETVSASTGAGNFICFLAAEADNWIQMGTSGTWDHQ